MEKQAQCKEINVTRKAMGEEHYLVVVFDSFVACSIVFEGPLSGGTQALRMVLS